MIIGLVGSGGREHALAKALIKPAGGRLCVYASGPNPGIRELTSDIKTGDLADPRTIARHFVERQADLVVIGPEAPLMTGLVDVLRGDDVPVIGPTQSQARLEGDKSFMRDLLRRRVGWGSPGWQLVENLQDARAFIREMGEVAVKPVGLTGGKGVQVMGVHLKDETEALAAAGEWIQKDGRVLLEERLVGEEFSRMVFVADGRVAPMPVAQDFKYAYDGDTGGMTGGMGAYTYASGSMPWLTDADLAEADRLITEVVAALEAETGVPYRGFLYGQFMSTRHGLRVIEFNTRLGDPEAINMMALFTGDLPAALANLANGRIDPQAWPFAGQASVVKYLVPQAYPEAQKTPYVFDLDRAAIEGAGFDLICSSVKLEAGRWHTLGSRTLALAGLGDDPGGVAARMEDMLARVEPAGLRHRRDVGDARILQVKTERMAALKRE